MRDRTRFPNRFSPTLLCLLFVVVSVAAQDGAQKPYSLEGHELKPSGAIVFAGASAHLLPESEKALDAVKAYLDDKKAVTLLRIEAHTDADGDDEAGRSLSERRALAVARRLVEKGVDCKRLVAVGFGASKPVAPNDTPENRAKNRRVAFFNAGFLGRLIGGMPADGGGKVAGETCPE
jgi:OOP family OmpA-OmpF porin